MFFYGTKIRIDIYISILLVTKNQNVRTSYPKRAHVLLKTSVRFK